MNKLKIIVGVLALLSLLLGQCSCPYSGDSPSGSFGNQEHRTGWYYDSVQLTGEWNTLEARWNFAEDGKLTINSKGKITEAKWIGGEENLEIIIDGTRTTYNVNVISETKFQLYTESTQLDFEK